MSKNLPIFFLLFLVSITSSAEVLFSDSFESKDMSAPHNQPNSTNVINANWEGNNRTSIVGMDPDSVAVYNNGSINNIQPGNDWNAKDGQFSLRFRYSANENMTEQRFNFDPQTEIWIGYWVRVPANFYHGSLNNKFFSIWGSTYDSLGTVTWQTRPSGSGNAVIAVQDGGVLSGESNPTPFIDRATDLGRWMRVVMHIKYATSSSSNDAIIQLWRRWENESAYTLIHDIQDGSNQWESDALGYRRGYFFGWANDAYDSTTEWLIDQPTFASSSLLNDESSPADALPPSNFSGNQVQ